MHDMLGINNITKVFKEIQQSSAINDQFISDYIKDVKSGDFPNNKEQYYFFLNEDIGIYI